MSRLLRLALFALLACVFAVVAADESVAPEAVERSLTATHEEVERDVIEAAEGVFERDGASDEATVEVAHGKRDTHRKHHSRSAAVSYVNLAKAGVWAFRGNNGPGIGSWFRTNTGGDSTNGHSWCGYPYHDYTNGFAPDVQVMLKAHGYNYQKAAKAFCGLEAEVTTPSGHKKLMYIVDGFDHRWVRCPGSIDIIRGQFSALFGRNTWNKNDVIKGLHWKLTGRRSKQYQFKGRGN